MADDDASLGSADTQRLAIRGRVVLSDDPQLQDLLAGVHDSAERPRCLCVPGGVEMYVAFHRRYLVKRMPDTGPRHHPCCAAYGPADTESGLGELLGEAVLESEPGRLQLRVDFPWTRRPGQSRSAAARQEQGEVVVPRKRMSLRAVLHLLFDRAGFNRWSPAMAGKRNQGVLCKYLLEAAADIEVRGEPLVQRLFVPEPFREERKAEIAQRLRARLAALQPREGQTPVGLVVGEFKACDRALPECRIWIRHMPDLPLSIPQGSWDRLARRQAAVLDAWHADGARRMRLAIAALIRARSECSCEVEAATLMLVSADWLPLNGVHELALVEDLVAQGRRFLKPMRYDAVHAGGFPNALLLDAGTTPIPLHVWSGFLPAEERAQKERAIASPGTWVWRTDQAMPSLPPKVPYRPPSEPAMTVARPQR